MATKKKTYHMANDDGTDAICKTECKLTQRTKNANQVTCKKCKALLKG